MNSVHFQQYIRGAEAYKRQSGPPEVYFLEGYVRGLRRHFHGQEFGTEEDHDLWMKAKDQRRDTQRRFCGLGYFAGHEGLSLTEALEQFAKTLARSRIAATLGAATSEKKTVAARQNAKRPRPGAYGKTKPRKTAIS